MNSLKQTTSQLVCKLTDKEFAQQVEFLRSAIFSKVKAITEQADGYTYEFEEPEEFYLKITKFIVYERQCCPFFRFALDFEPDKGPVELRIYGSKEVKQVLLPMIEGSDLKAKLRQKGLQ